MIRRILVLALLLAALPVRAGRSFAGTDLIVANGIGSALDIATGPVSVSAWFNATTLDTATEDDIVSHWQGAGVSGGQWLICTGHCAVEGGTSANNTVQWEIGCCGGLSGNYGNCGTIVTNQWYGVVMTADTAGTFSGTPAYTVHNSATGCNTISGYSAYHEKRSAGGANLNIGGHNGTATFKGIIADVCVWNATLNQMEMVQILAGVECRNIRPYSLVGYWPLYGAKSPEPDLSGHVLNGTLTGTSPAAHAPVGPPTGATR